MKVDQGLDRLMALKLMKWEERLTKDCNNYYPPGQGKYKYNLAWVTREDNKYFFKYYTECLDDCSMYPDEYWSPSSVLDQAIECASKYDKIFISISQTPLGWVVTGVPDVVIVVDQVYEIPLAICTMIQKGMKKL